MDHDLENLILRRAIEQGILTQSEVETLQELELTPQTVALSAENWGKRIGYLIQQGRLDEVTVKSLIGRNLQSQVETVPQEKPVPDHSEALLLQVGQVFRGLLIHSLLGTGAMGAAYLASHPILKMPLVIKTFKTATDLSIFKEAHLAARVTATNVVSVLDAGLESGIAFAVQRYVDGIDLWELVNSTHRIGMPLPISMVCRIVIDSAKGLHAIHQAGVIHRDIKPSNLFLCGDGTTVIGDFGIALDANREKKSEIIAGTPQFMAPEQLLGEELDRRTDIFALGATTHLLATGKFTLTAQNLRQLAQAIEKPYLPPPTSDPCEAYLFSAVSRMLRKKPEERYQTAEAVVQTLEVIAQPMPNFLSTHQDEAWIGSVRLSLVVGNLTTQKADVIVNAANTLLLMGVGVAAALRVAGGEVIEQEAQQHAPAAMGTVVWTQAGQLQARWVAHAVAALDGAICLQRCTLRVLLGAEARESKSVAFPALGTGVGEVPMDLAAKLMLEAIRTFAALHPHHVESISIVLRTEEAAERWRMILHSM